MEKAFEGDPELLDLSGLKCPLPALKVRKALARMEQGGALHVICSDPMAVIDIPHVVRECSALLLDQGQNGDRLWFHIQKPV